MQHNNTHTHTHRRHRHHRRIWTKKIPFTVRCSTQPREATAESDTYTDDAVIHSQLTVIGYMHEMEREKKIDDIDGRQVESSQVSRNNDSDDGFSTLTAYHPIPSVK